MHFTSDTWGISKDENWKDESSTELRMYATLLSTPQLIPNAYDESLEAELKSLHSV